MTNKPKSITLQEFEELAKAFVQTDIQTQRNYYDHEGYKLDDNDVASEFVGLFKTFAFKEELEKDQRRKDYEKLKEEYLKLKDEFESESAEVEYVKQPETNICVGCCFLTKSNECSQPRNLGNSCEDDRHIWIKA